MKSELETHVKHKQESNGVYTKMAETIARGRSVHYKIDRVEWQSVERIGGAYQGLGD